MHEAKQESCANTYERVNQDFVNFQLLKALFGTNLSSQLEDIQMQMNARKPGKSMRLSGTKDGLYQSIFTLPYSQFTQSLAAATIKAVSPDYEDTTGYG